MAEAEIDRRQLLAAGGACLAACAARAQRGDEGTAPLDALLAAHADALPEATGAGANHDPMAAEALEALGREDAIPETWVRRAAGYAGAVPRVAALDGGADGLGAYGRYGDWLDRFRGELARDRWETVLARWAPVLAPGLAGAAFHGLIRTGHAARALSRRDTSARRGELAVGLAYWAARYTELPSAAGPAPPLHALAHPWLDDATDVDFFAVTARLAERPLAPPPELPPTRAAARAALGELVRAAAAAHLEMLVQERHRIWMLHAVTAPAAVALLLPSVDDAGARALVAHVHRAVIALVAAYGAPHVPREHVRAAPGAWPELADRAAASGSVHTIKLVEALARSDRDGDPLYRSTAVQWLEWT